MPKRSTHNAADPYLAVYLEPEFQSWAMSQLKAPPAKLVGVVTAPDEETAIAMVIKLFNVSPDQHDRLTVRRLD